MNEETIDHFNEMTKTLLCHPEWVVACVLLAVAMILAVVCLSFVCCAPTFAPVDLKDEPSPWTAIPYGKDGDGYEIRDVEYRIVGDDVEFRYTFTNTSGGDRCQANRNLTPSYRDGTALLRTDEKRIEMLRPGVRASMHETFMAPDDPDGDMTLEVTR